MPFKQTFLERTPQVPESVLDRLEQLLRSKIDLKTGYAEPHALARCMFQTLKSIDMSDDQVMTKDTFQSIMDKLNCGEDKLACAALFHRYDRRGTGRLSLKDFSDGLFGLLPVAGSDAECRDITMGIRQELQARGDTGFRTLANTLRSLCKTKSGLSLHDLERGFETCGIRVTAYELKTLMFYFDKETKGCISVNELMVGLRPRMSDARLALVKLAFLRLDKNPDGLLTLSGLMSMFNSSSHPSVLRGEMSSQDVEKDFVEAWRFASDIINESDFIDYYSDLSATIDNDSYFELLLRNSWRVSGGGKTAQSGQPIRLLVTHMDGTSSIETLDGDLGVDTQSNASLVAALRKQGVSDILKAELALYR